MRYVFLLFVFLPLSLLMSGIVVASEDCLCPVEACSSPCEESQGLDFYTQKCDGGSGLKSCARPLCKPKVPAPLGCAVPVAAKIGDSENVVKTRKLASEAVDFARAEYVSGKVMVERSGHQIQLNAGDSLLAGDIVETNSSSEARLKTHSGDTLHVQNSTRMTLVSVQTAKVPAVIQLLRGKIRSQVTKAKPVGESVFQVETRSAVAGVRGTDFITSYQLEPQEKTVVETLEGDVVLYGKAAPDKQVHVRHAEYATYVVDQKAVNVDSDEFVISGTLSQARDMADHSVQELAKVTWVGPRKSRSGDGSKAMHRDLCQTPSGRMNDCSWTCINNPQREKTCRTDRGDVQCVRKRCNANGEWTEETRLPASFHDFCNPAGPRVAPCDY